MSLSTFVGHLRHSITTWWSNHTPGATIKAAVDTLNSLGVTEPQLEAIGKAVISINGDTSTTGLGKAVKVAETIATWTGDLTLPAPAAEAVHVVISLVHLIAKLSGKL